MGVAEEHSRVSMAADRCNLRDGQAQLEEAADRLVAQVVKMQVVDSGALRETVPSQTDSIRGYREYASRIKASAGFQGRERLIG